MKLMLHIGTEKTGTTSLQNWMYANRADLAEQGIWYPANLGRANHTSVYLYALGGHGDHQGYVIHRRAATADQRAQIVKASKIDIENEIIKAKNAGCHTFFLSNEHCHSRLVTSETVKACRLSPGTTF